MSKWGNHKVIKENDKQNLFSDMSFEEIEKELLNYLDRENPEKMKFEPKLIAIKGRKIIFGMKKHYGNLVLKIPELNR